MVKSLSNRFHAYYLQLTGNWPKNKQLSSLKPHRYAWIYRALAFNLLLVLAICAPLLYSN